MEADRLVARAREEHAAGRQSAALRSAWEAVQSAMLRQDEAPVREVEELARGIAAASEGSTRTEAERLTDYCAALLDGVGGGVRAPSLLDRLFGGLRKRDAAPPDLRRPCPECAESIKADAKVCRFCGHRLDGSAPA